MQAAGTSTGGRAPKKELAKKAARKVVEEEHRAHAYPPYLRAYRRICHFQRTTEVLTSVAALVRYIKSAMDELPDRTYNTPTRIKKAVAFIIHE